MFRLFRSVLPKTSKSLESKKISMVTSSFDDFFRDETSVEYFKKSQENFEMAQHFFKEKNLQKARDAINEAIVNGSKVESIGPRSFMLNFFSLKRDISASAYGEGNTEKEIDVSLTSKRSGTT